jgi:ribosomal protein L37AE/L43A
MKFEGVDDIIKVNDTVRDYCPRCNRNTMSFIKIEHDESIWKCSRCGVERRDRLNLSLWDVALTAEQIRRLYKRWRVISE